MNLALDHLAAVAADEFLLDDPEFILVEDEDHASADICWESARASVAGRVLPLDHP